MAKVRIKSNEPEVFQLRLRGLRREVSQTWCRFAGAGTALFSFEGSDFEFS